MSAHRHTLGHEHDYEPVYGLPEVPPPDERILWQGAPDWRALAVRAFHVRKLVAYFGVILAARGVVVLGEGASAWEAARAVAWLAPLALLGIGLMLLLAWFSARTTAYTLTNRRVVMRIGIVLTLSINLPFKRIAAADLSAGPNGSGDIALALTGRDRIAFLQLWPHARAWRLTRPEPTLRCLSDATDVARLLAQHWSQATGQEVQAIEASEPVGTPPASSGHRVPSGAALAGR